MASAGVLTKVKKVAIVLAIPHPALSIKPPMKARLFWVVVPALALTFGACDSNKKEASANPTTATTPATSTPADPQAPAPVAPAAPAAATQPATLVTAAAAEVKPLGAEERAAKLGFARYLPADTESLITVHNGTKIGESAKSLKLWKVAEEGIGGLFGMGRQGMPPGGMPPDMEPTDDDFAIPEEGGDAAAPVKPPAVKPIPKAGDDAQVGVLRSSTTSTLITADAADDEAAAEGAVAGALLGAAVDEEEMEDNEVGGDAQPMDEMEESPSAGDMLGLEVTFAVGKGAGEQLGNVLTLANRVNYFQMRSLAKGFVAALKSGDLDDMGTAMESGMEDEMAKSLVNDPESGISLVERANMPPVYVAFRTTKEKQEAVANLISGWVNNISAAGEMVEPVTIEQAGATLSGFQLLGAKVAEEMGNDRAEMDEMIGAETADKLMAALAKKNLVVASGTLGDYVVIFIGASAADCKLVAEPAQSLAGGNALAFADAYAAKDLIGLIYGNDSASKALLAMNSGLSTYTNGLRDGLASAEGGDDTRDLEALLQIVAERDAALRKLCSSDALGVVAFFDEGLKVESFGGYDAGAIDWKAPSKLAHLGDLPDVAVFANVTSDATYDEKVRALAESLVEMAYATTMKVSEMPSDEEAMKPFKEGIKLFNDKFRTDALALWDAVKGDFTSGVGKESALVVDLKGSMPTVPGLPQAVLDKAKFPRVTMILPVTDRTKLKTSWAKVNESATKLLASVSEMVGQDIPMQKPISSEKDGYTTWFLSLPFQSPDFIPSMTVGDKWLAASTSKDRALELLAQAEKGTPGRTGFWMKVDFKAFQAFAAETMTLLDENADGVLGEGSTPLAQVKATKELRDKLVDAMSDLDSITVHSRRENGQLRGSCHLKTR